LSLFTFFDQAILLLCGKPFAQVFVTLRMGDAQQFGGQPPVHDLGLKSEPDAGLAS
jgi:hypothetical protein